MLLPKIHRSETLERVIDGVKYVVNKEALEKTFRTAEAPDSYFLMMNGMDAEYNGVNVQLREHMSNVEYIDYINKKASTFYRDCDEYIAADFTFIFFLLSSSELVVRSESDLFHWINKYRFYKHDLMEFIDLYAVTPVERVEALSWITMETITPDLLSILKGNNHTRNKHYIGDYDPSNPYLGLIRPGFIPTLTSDDEDPSPIIDYSASRGWATTSGFLTITFPAPVRITGYMLENVYGANKMKSWVLECKNNDRWTTIDEQQSAEPLNVAFFHCYMSMPLTVCRIRMLGTNHYGLNIMALKHLQFYGIHN